MWFLFLVCFHNRSEDNIVSIGHQALSEARLQALENRLLHHIDSKISEMERRINSRLDEILNLLSSKLQNQSLDREQSHFYLKH